jgi:tRNA (cytidine/uridine-2'-O-)-methyltransferase
MSQNSRHASGAPRSALRLTLYQPDIAANTGTLLRLCACLGVAVDIVEPAGFPVSDRAFRRAGLDYLDEVEIERHASFEHFDGARRAGGRRLVLLTTAADVAYTEFAFAATDCLMLGRESAGVPAAVHERADARILVPMRAGLRSLNVAVAGAMALGEALRQTGGFPPAAPRVEMVD